MKCGRRAVGVELAVAMDSLARRQDLDLDTSLPELLNRLRIGTHLPVRARAYNQALRQLVDDLREVGKDESVPIGPPLIGEHTLGQDDHVTRLLLTVDDEMTESVSLNPPHRLTSGSSLRSGPCRACKKETCPRPHPHERGAGGLIADPDVFRLSALEELIGPFERGVAALADRDAEVALRVRRSERRERLASVCQFVAVLDRDAEGSVVEEFGEALQVLGCRLGHEVEAPGALHRRPQAGMQGARLP